ncbi:hypothetical protein BDV06DRAFT_219140 [Aspergillus oleicola]
MEIKRKPVAPLALVDHDVQRPLIPNPPPPYSPYRAYTPYSPSASPIPSPSLSYSPHSPHSPHSYFPPPPPRFTPSPSSLSTPSIPPSLRAAQSQPNLRGTSSSNLSIPLPPPPPRPVPRAETTTTLPPTLSPPPPPPFAESNTTAQSPDVSKDSKSTFAADARHFLGGLISHPSESTRHYSILRHSHGIVFYRGPTTSVTVSIFADTPLPPDRSLWLQCKGWSGKTGMRAKALFRMHDDWVHVSPSIALRAEQVEREKERAWQRDIAKFYKKASSRVRDTHVLRETIVSRVPPDAEDGYFQLVLCQGQGSKKKVLCRSPVFRILSTSLDPSSLRGASLTTMPLEIGAFVAGKYAQVAASRVVTPATAVANTVTSKYKPGWVKEAAIRTAYDAVKPGPAGSGPDAAMPPSIENGPQPPYPLDFTAKPSQSLDPMRMPVKIPSDIQDKLRGYFFGWARTPDQPWNMIILSVRLFDGTTHSTGPVSLSHTTRKIASLRLLHEPLPNHSSNITVRILGFLRADIPPPSPRTETDLAAAHQAAAEAAVVAEQYDSEYAQALLDHPLWGPEAGDRKGWFEKTRDGAGNAITQGKKLVERVGVRSGVEVGGDIGGGFYIVRG